MWNNWIGRRIRRAGRTQLWCGVALCALAAVVARVGRDRFYDTLAGPTAVDATSLASPEAAGKLWHRTVTFTSDTVTDTGETVSPPGKPDRILARYLAVRAGDRWLLTLVPPDHEGNIFTGMVTAPGFKLDSERFLPFQLDETLIPDRPAVTGLLFLVVFLATGLVLAARGLWLLRHPEAHPLAGALARFGQPAEVAGAIGRSGQPLRLGPVEFAGDWFICQAPRTGWTVFRVDDLVWVHALIETVNRTPLHRIKLYDRTGVMFTGRGRRDVIEAVLATVTARAPWLVVGWDERVAKQWQEDPASLVPRVEERREELRARAAGQSQPQGEVAGGPADAPPSFPLTNPSE
jgi:hypothetical protein